MADEYDPLLSVDPLIHRAMKRFKRCREWESNARNLWIQDLKFANADSDNGYQWPNDIRRNRDVDERPVLTINITRQHNLQIMNDSKQNKPGIMIRPVGGGATYEAAQTLEGICRHIEYISRANIAYDTATRFQVQAGIGYWRIVTDYRGDDTFDQEIYIREVQDPLTIYLDPDIQTKDGSDARFGFAFEDKPVDEFEALYPRKYKELTEGAMGRAALDNTDDWITKDHIRIAEYFERVEKKFTLVSFIRNGVRNYIRKDMLPEGEIRDFVMDDPLTQTRTVLDKSVKWYKIIGNEVDSVTDWPSQYIPIVRLIGEEVVIENRMDRKGHTRAMKDPQRMYNYWSSSAVEQVALQSKTPWVASASAIEGHEVYWNTANRTNHAVLPYNDWDDDGARKIDPPQRPGPPVMADAYLKGMEIARQELMMVSGQYQPQLGEPSNERSGVAIQERQRQGDNATYHYIDNLAVAIRHTGAIILDLIPKIYDTERIIKIMAEDGQSQEVRIDPSAAQAYRQTQDRNGKVAQRILNPNIGYYEVQADIGPSFGTKRQEAFNALTQIITQAPALTQIIGDLLLDSADFPLSREAAQRLRRLVPKQALGEGPTQQEQLLAQQVQQLRGLLGSTMEELGTERGKRKSTDAKRDIDAYDAETQRLRVLADHVPMDRTALEAIVRQMVADILRTSLTQVVAAEQPGLTGVGAGPTPGAGPGAGAGAGARPGPRLVSPSPAPGPSPGPGPTPGHTSSPTPAQLLGGQYDLTGGQGGGAAGPGPGA